MKKFTLEEFVASPKRWISPPMAKRYLKVSSKWIETLMERGTLESCEVQAGRKRFRYIGIKSLRAYQEARLGNPAANLPILRRLLVAAARCREVVSYGEAMAPLKLDSRNPRHRAQIGRLLGDISEASHAKYGLLLSALVVHAGGDRLPNASFFRLARELGVMDDGDDQEAFWRAHLRRVYRQYRRA